jgi:hypothetical protein
MKIYDYETFEKNCKNIKAIKFKEPEEVQDYDYYYNKVFFGKKFNAIYNSEISGIINIKVYIMGVFKRNYTITFDVFNDVVEYVEVNAELEIE